MTPKRSRVYSSHSSPKARILHISSTNRMPEFTKKLMRPTARSNCSSVKWPRSLIRSSREMAFASAKASSWVGVAAASCRWYEQMFEAFHEGISSRQNSYISAISRRLCSGG